MVRMRNAQPRPTE